MHIGIVAPCSSGPLADLLPEGGGVDLGCGGHLIATLARALVGLGHRVSIVTLSTEIETDHILRGPRMTYYVYPMRLRRRMRDLFDLERRGLRAGIRSAQPDILHAHWTYEWAMAALETGLPTLVTTHDDGVRMLLYSRDLYRLGRLYMQIRVLRQARFVTAVSPHLAESVRRLTGVPVDVVPNPIEVGEIIEDPVGRRSDGPTIATVLNGWGRRKNPKSAIEAFNRLLADVPGAEMHMFGWDFQEGGPAWKWATKAELNRSMIFRGPLSRGQLLDELGRMSILLHPALEECCPMAVVEAMALRVPVVAGAKSGGVPWVLDHGRAGFLTNVREPRAMAETLLACIRNADERAQKTRNAYERATTYFSPRVVAEKYERIYEQVLAVA